MLRALSKTLAGGEHCLVLLDAPAVRGEQVKEVWLLGEQEGYEVVVVQPQTSDPQVGVSEELRGELRGGGGVSPMVCVVGYKEPLNGCVGVFVLC